MGATGTGLCELKAQLASIQLITTWSEQMTAQLAAAGGIPTAVCTRSLGVGSAVPVLGRTPPSDTHPDVPLRCL